MNSRFIVSVAVAGFTGVASAQSTTTNSLSVIGATQVRSNTYEVDISSSNAGSLTIVLSSQLINPGNLRGIASARGNLITTNTDVDIAFGATTHLTPYDLTPSSLGGPISNYQPGYNSSNFPSNLPQPDEALLGIGSPVPVYSLVINYSNASDISSLTVSDDFISSFIIGDFLNFMGLWFPIQSTTVATAGAEPITITFVPAPGTLALLSLGGLLATRRRR